MKKIGMIVVIGLCLAFSLNANASTETVLEEQYQASGLEEVMDSLEPKSKALLEQWGISLKDGLLSEGIQLKDFGTVLKEILIDTVQNPLSACTAAAGVVLLCAVAHRLVPSERSGMGLLEYFGGLCLGVVWMIPVGELLAKSLSAVAAVGQFMMLFIPVYVGILMRAGRPLLAGSTGGVVFGLSQVLVFLSKQLLLPFMGMFLALSLSQSLSGEMKTEGLASATKKISVWMLSIATTVYSALLSITGVINGAADSVAQRTTRFFIGNMVPVIGNTLSESLSTLQTCFGLLKTGGGMLAIGAVIALLLPVVVEILLWRFGTMLLVALSEWMETVTMTRLLHSVGEAIGLLFAIVICCFAVLVVAVGVMSMAGGG